MPGSPARKRLRTLWEESAFLWLGFAIKRVGNRADARDVVQDAVASTLAAEPEFESDEEANAYVLAAIHTAVGMRARGARRSARARERLPEGAASPRSDRTPLDLLIEVERQGELERLYRRALAEIRELPDEEREGLELTVLREPSMTLKEVADRQGVTVSTVHYRVKRGVAKVRTALETALEGHPR